MNDNQPAVASADTAYPPELARLEDDLVKERRKGAGLPPNGPRIGVALSGGGIRSATFCLGVFQALAKAKSETPGGLLGRIDFLSTVSGGGYFGSFLGRIFARAHIQGPADVAKVLTGEEQPAKGQTTFRFLRDNGRYLAPRGSGDLLQLITITVRNWLAVQTVLSIAVLAVFVALQYADMRLPPVYSAFCEFMPLCGWARADYMPIGVVQSPWFMWLIPLFALWVVPSAWAYWVVTMPLTKRQLFRRTDVVVLAVLAVAWAVGWIPRPNVDGTWPPPLVGAAAVAVLAGAAFLWALLCNPLAMFDWLLGILHIGSAEKAVAHASRSRNALTVALKRGLVVVAIVGVVAAVDSLGATAYALFRAEEGFTRLTTALATVLGAFGGVAVFGRQLLVFLSGEGENSGKSKRPRVPLSIVSWLVAILVLGAWLITWSAVSHGVAWQGVKPPYADALFTPPPTKIVDASAVVLTAEPGGTQTLRPLEQQQQSVFTPSTAAERSPTFTGRVLLLLILVVAAVGSVRTLLNASSMHMFYAQRLTRAYLGASNRKRLDDDQAHITEVIEGDDLPSDRYWNWPRLPHEPGGMDRVRAFFASGVHGVRSMFTKSTLPAREPPASPARTQASKGAPLHLVNVTINETLDGRTGVQIQDRKGVPLAVGPGGLSVGVRHHLIADEDVGFVAKPGDGHAVFALERLRDAPEVMTLGRWVSLSGAAFSSALGARTTVPLAFLATFANVRLGYWWDSGLGKGWTGPLLPVYRGLLSELIARLRGTGIRLWNLTDGGHFENLGGYELIRRKLPVIVLIDAEADPDFEFPGLSELIRKARLDFGAEIHFLDEDELRALKPRREEGFKLGPISLDEEPPVFTTLERLRRGKWNSDKDARAALSAEADRREYSHAHAALATVTYRDGTVGRIVYVKASLTGREPADVLQYHAEHPDFPHETTSDQFFDEAQWESYRRLGEYVGGIVLIAAVLSG
ncbi:MAG: hypothetical protein ABI640_20625 [Gammaproteobacteria bacterium]